jgi:hypothetical protein
MHTCAWPSFARLVIVCAGNFGILLLSLLMGTGTGMHIYLCTGAWIGVVLFAPHERKSLAFSVILPTVLFFGYLVFDHHMGGWNPQPPQATRNIALYNVIGFQVVQVIAMLYF